MQIARLVQDARRGLLRDFAHLFGLASVASGDVRTDESSQMCFDAAARVVPQSDEDVMALFTHDPWLSQSPIISHVMEMLDYEDTPAGHARAAQVVYEVYQDLSVYYEEMQGEDPERIVVVTAGRNGIRLHTITFPENYPWACAPP